MTSSERRFKEAFKTALAMVLAYGIALSWDWMNPYWAGFAVAMISLPTAGQSVEKGAMRLLGTLMASIAALTLIGFYPQDRWLFMACVSVYVGFCTYMMFGGRYQYFWLVSGFVALIICVAGGPNPQDAFDIAVTRTLETALGIIVYTLVSVFLWPQRSAAQFEETARRLLGSQRKLFETYRGVADHKESQVESPPNPVQEAQLLARLAQLLSAAASESYEVRERRDDWLRLHQETGALMRDLESWRASFPEIRHLDLEKLIPNLEEVYRDIEKTFDGMALAWAGTRSDFEPSKIELDINRSEALQLSHLDRAALVLTKTNLAQVTSRCHQILESVRALKGLAKSVRRESPPETAPPVSLVDPDRLYGVVKVTGTLWIAFLIWVYFDPPGHAGFVQLSGTFALVLVSMPQARASMLFLPFAIGSGFAAIVYFIVMPRLSGYLELAAVLFAAVFMINFIYYQPRQGLSKLAGLVTLLVVTSIQNQQSYSFPQFANTLTMILLVVAFLAALSYVPHSPRPEKVFLRLLSRYAHSSACLLDRLERVGQRQWWVVGNMKADHCRCSLQNLPGRLGQVSQGIDFRSLSLNNRDQVQALLASIHTLNVRILALEEAHWQSRSDLLSASLCDDMVAWRHSLLKLFRDWGDNTPSGSHDDLAKRLQLGLAKIEARMEEGLKPVEGERSNDESYLKVYRLLGSYRGLSEAVVAYWKVSDGIDWSRWREARF